MDTSPDLLTRLYGIWHSLREGIRDNVIAELIFAGLSVTAVVSRKAIVHSFRRLFKRDSRTTQPTQIQQQQSPPPPQRVIVELDATRLTAPVPPEPLKPELPKPEPPAPSPEFLRPPAFGFVARRDEQGQDIIERLKKELAPGRNQLVTLSGKGGVGKTTLAVEAFRILSETYEGRLVWSDATARAGYTLPTLLDDAATQLGRAELRALAPEVKEAAVRALFVEHHALIALDNYETIDKAEQERIEDWLAHTPCSSLTTSRQKIKDTLNIVIPTMPPDEAQEFLAKRIAQTQAAQQTQDAQLFTAEVRQRIYETAEGNPFLMEWVVAQVDDAQEPDTVLEELKHGEGDAAERVFGRSFMLPQVGEDGRAALLALSLFVPSASRPALAAVAGFADDEKRLNAAIKSLHALWLVKGLDGNRRFTVEGLTRSLASARLSKVGRADEFRQRFIAYFLQYAESHNQLIPEDFEALEIEKDNVLSAIDLASEMKDWISVVQLMSAVNSDGINGMLAVRGYWDDAVKYNYRALDAGRFLNDEHAIAVYSHRIALIQKERGLYDEARRAYEAALVIYRKQKHEYNIAVALESLARLSLEQGELSEARRLYNESLGISRKLDSQKGISVALDGLGAIAYRQSDFKEARRLFDESLEIDKRVGDQRGVASTLHLLGRLAHNQGDLEGARRLYNESLEIKKRLGDQRGVAVTLDGLGTLENREGNVAEAARLLSESLSIFERLGSPDAEVVRRHLEELKGKA
jgi:tetratricopeptide (TPR) repeat protein